MKREASCSAGRRGDRPGRRRVSKEESETGGASCPLQQGPGAGDPGVLGHLHPDSGQPPFRGLPGSLVHSPGCISAGQRTPKTGSCGGGRVQGLPVGVSDVRGGGAGTLPALRCSGVLAPPTPSRPLSGWGAGSRPTVRAQDPQKGRGPSLAGMPRPPALHGGTAAGARGHRGASPLEPHRAADATAKPARSTMPRSRPEALPARTLGPRSGLPDPAKGRWSPEHTALRPPKPEGVTRSVPRRSRFAQLPADREAKS